MNENIDYGIYYRTWHNESDEHMESMGNYMANLLLPCLDHIDRSSHILEIGCGMGFTQLGLKKLGFENINGIDIDQSQIEVCQRRQLNVELVTNSIVYLEANKQRYNVVILLDVLEHLPCKEQIPLMRGVFASLQAGGVVILKVPNANSIIASRWRYNDFTHYSSFTEHSLRFVILNAGFSKVEMIKESPLIKPSLSIWKPYDRKIFWKTFWKWVIRKFWRKVLEVELGEGWIDIPIELNLLAIAYR